MTNFWRATKLKLGGTKCFLFFTFYNWYGFEIINPCSWIFNAFSEKSCPTPMPLLLTSIWRQGSIRFSRLLNPDWSVQISGTPAECKACGTLKLGLMQYLPEMRDQSLFYLKKLWCFSMSEALCLDINFHKWFLLGCAPYKINFENSMSVCSRL